MDGPNTVRLQRRRNELPPDQLYVERKRKHDQQTEETRGYYIRQKRETDASVAQVNSGVQNGEPLSNASTQSAASASARAARREFHLRHASLQAPSVQSTKTRKRKRLPKGHQPSETETHTILGKFKPGWKPVKANQPVDW